MKKMLSLALALCLALSLLSFSAAEEPAADLVNIQVLFTSDIHGAIVDSAYSSGDAETVQGTSLAKLATLIKQYRAEHHPDRQRRLHPGHTLHLLFRVQPSGHPGSRHAGFPPPGLRRVDPRQP